MRKKLWLIFGPIFLAGSLTVALFLLPNHSEIGEKELIKQASTSLNEQVLKGELIKETALKEDYIPVIGSSELSRFSPYHPSVLQAKYQNSSPLFLMGSAGTQSLTHFLSLAGLPIQEKKAVVILSPQWFVAKGVKEDYFNYHYSPFLVKKWLLSVKHPSEENRYVASRLLSFPKVTENALLKGALEKIKEGKSPSKLTQYYYQVQTRWERNEEWLFSKGLDFNENQQKMNRFIQKLPYISSYQLLREAAVKDARKVTTNNPFKMKDNFYQKRILPKLPQLQNSQQKFDYTKSPEFSDFQLLLSYFKKEQVTPLFVIPPVSKRWSDYTGLSQEMLSGFAKKIQFQLQTQGFNNILDLHQKASEDYFLEDTIHLGWLGWLSVDEGLNQFLKTPQPPVNYQLNDYFYTPKWQQLDYQTLK